MRIPSSAFAVGRYAAGLLLVAGSLALMSAPRKTQFTVHDRAYYASAETVNFVRPGLSISIVSMPSPDGHRSWGTSGRAESS